MKKKFSNYLKYLATSGSAIFLFAFLFNNTKESDLVIDSGPGLMNTSDIVSQSNTSSDIIIPDVVEDKKTSNTEDFIVESIEHLPSLRVNILYDVPFTSQAPLADWSDERQQDGCEEASVLMAVKWGRKETLSPQESLKEILAAADYTNDKYGEYRDTDLEAVLNWLIIDYFQYEKAEIIKDVSITTLIELLENGRIIIMPANGQALKNPNFKAPGPLNHMLLIRGYDYSKKTFITNDPGTRLGNLYEYPEDILYSALRTYPTGYKEDNLNPRRDVIAISR